MTTEKWHADIKVTDELVTHCLQEQFPLLIPCSLCSTCAWALS